MALSNEQWNAPSGDADFYEHQIAHSCRFKSATSDDLHRTFGTSSDLAKFTFSCWVKRSLTHANGGNAEWQNIIGNTTGVDGGGAAFGFESGGGTSGGLNNRDRIAWYGLAGAGGGNNGGDDRIAGYFYDTSAWYHIVVRVDTGQNAATKIRYYVNGDLKARTATNEPTGNMSRFNTAAVHYIGALANGNYDLDALLAEVIFTDGQSYAPTQFGETKNGVWIPKDASGSTFGTNGFHLNFANASALGNDVSGNDNDWTVANLTAHDQMLDSPTFGDGSNGGNFCTINPMAQQGGSTIDRSGDLSEGNLLQVLSGSESGPTATMGFNSTSGGKWYWEVHINTFKAGGIIGIVNEKFNIDSEICYNSPGSPTGADAIGIYFDTGNVYAGVQDGGTSSGYGDQLANGDVIGVAVDVDNAKIWFSKNGTFYNSGNPANGGAAARGAGGTITTAMAFSRTWFPVAGNWSAANGLVTWNFGQEGTFAGAETAGGNADDNGFGNFFTSPPSGYLALCSGNLPNPGADPVEESQPKTMFQSLLYTGNGQNGHDLTTVMKADSFWGKNRARGASTPTRWFNTTGHNFGTGTEDYVQFDIDDYGFSNSQYQGVSGATTTNITVGNVGYINVNTDSYVAFLQGSNSATAVTDTSGDIDVARFTNADAGMSVMYYTGNGQAGNIPHGLGVKPTWTITKNSTNQNSIAWRVWSDTFGDYTTYGVISSTGAWQTSGGDYTGEPTATMLPVNTNNTVNADSNTYMTWAYANADGMIRSGEYRGNGQADGTYVNCGFKPAFVLYKNVANGESWVIIDNARTPFNGKTAGIFTEASSPESDSVDTYGLDLLSNGFKARGTNAVVNGAGVRYMFLAMAENPFKYAVGR